MRVVRLTFRFLHLLVVFAPVLGRLPFVLVIPGSRPSTYDALVRALERAGATFIKMGQIASSRPDLIPPDMCQALSKLHDDAPAHSARDTNRLVQDAFGRSLEEIFQSFEPEPLASGSIAQVHRGVLANGTEVAVKVRHPSAARVIDTDLAIIRFFARLIDKIPSLHWVALPESAETFSETMANQLDLVAEARHLEQFGKNFADVGNVHFPSPVSGLVHETVLIESFEPGVPIARYVNSSDPRRADLARIGLDAFLQMVFKDGFVHADLHPGNLLVREAGDELHVVVLDTGMVAELGPTDLRNFTDTFGAIAARDGARAAELMIIHAPHQDCRDPDAFKHDIDQIFQAVIDLPMSEIEIAAVLSQIMNAVRRHRIKIESAFTSVNVGIMVLEGLGRQLDPDINLLEVAGPKLIQMQMERTAAELDAGARQEAVAP